MKQLLTIIFCAMMLQANAQEYLSNNINLLGTWAIQPQDFNKYGDHYSSCWGYAQNGREYAIVGCANGTAYIDVTNPASPVFVDFVESNVKDAIWREYKTYQHYAYQVSDDGGDNHFDIVDLSFLPDSVHVAYSGDDIFRRAHTVFIDGTRFYRGGNMKIYDLSKDPTKPELLLDNTIGYVHDMYVRNDTVYASQGDNGLFIYEFKDNNRLDLIGSFTNYPFAGYNHSSILSPDGKTLLVTDEVPGNLPAKSVDVSDPANPILVDTFYSQTGKATLHNPFHGPNNTCVMASYLDGVQVFDYSDPTEIKLRGYFDTHWQTLPEDTDGGYDGAWSAYAMLPSKNLIVVDITNGLYMLDASAAYAPVASKKDIPDAISIQSYPNPSVSGFKIQLPVQVSGKIEVKIADVSGKLIYQNILEAKQLEQKEFSSNGWAKGTYYIRITQGEKTYIAEQVIL